MTTKPRKTPRHTRHPRSGQLPDTAPPAEPDGKPPRRRASYARLIAYFIAALSAVSFIFMGLLALGAKSRRPRSDYIEAINALPSAERTVITLLYLVTPQMSRADVANYMGLAGEDEVRDYEARAQKKLKLRLNK